jgi:hypothetical protein|tara:strand:+ start:146 stop:667 length:522 start_codon:yes stop_codon:yes gene_type:complete
MKKEDIKKDSTTEKIKPTTIKAIKDLERLDQKFSDNEKKEKIKVSDPITSTPIVEVNQEEITQLITMINDQYKLARKKDLPQLTQISFRMAETAYQKKGTSSLGFLEDKPHYCLGLAALGIVIDIALDYQKSRKNVIKANPEVKNQVTVEKEPQSNEDLTVTKGLGGTTPVVN